MALRIVTPWRLQPPASQRARDRQLRRQLAAEIEKTRKLGGKRPSLAERQAAAFRSTEPANLLNLKAPRLDPTAAPQQPTALEFGREATRGQLGPFREEDLLRIGQRAGGRFREEIATDPIIQPGGADVGRLGLQQPDIELGRQTIPPGIADRRAADVLRVRDALAEEDMSPEDFRVAVQAGASRQQGNELASYTLPRDQREKYNRVVQKLDVEGTPILAQGLPPETMKRRLEADAREQGIDPDSLFLESPGAFWDQLFAIEQHEIARRTRPKIEKALKMAKVPNTSAILAALPLGQVASVAGQAAGVLPEPGITGVPAPEPIAKLAAEVAVPSSIAPIGAFGKAGRLTRITARGITEGTLNVMQDKAGRADRGEPAATPVEAAIMFAAGAVIGGTAPELIGVFARWLKGRVVAQTARGVPQERALTVAIAEATDETGAVRSDILQELSRDPDLAADAVRRRAAIIDAELSGRPEFAEPEAPVRAEPVEAEVPSRADVAAPTRAAPEPVAPAQVPRGPRSAARNVPLEQRVLPAGLENSSLGRTFEKLRDAGHDVFVEAEHLYRRTPEGGVEEILLDADVERLLARPAPARAVEPGAAPAVRQAAPAPPVAPAPARVVSGEATLPRELAGAKSRYRIGQKEFIPEFDSDVDKALFVVAQTKKSRRDASYMAFLRGVFPNAAEPEIRAVGREVRDEIKAIAKVSDEGPITIPTTNKRPGPVERVVTEPAVAPSQPTVKTRTLFGEEVDTFATERELGGVREQQGGLALEERAPVEEPPDIFGRTTRDITEELRIVDEDLAQKRLPKGARAEFKAQKLKLEEEQRIIDQLGEFRGNEDVILEGLERELEDVSFDLSRKDVPFGGRAGVSVGQARKQRLRGGGTTISRTSLDTPQLVARMEALQEWVPRLREQVGPGRPPTREQLVFREASPGREPIDEVVTTADFDVPAVRGGAGTPALMEGGNPVNIELWRAVERGKITSDLAADRLRSIGETLSNVPSVGRAVKLGAGPQVIGRTDPATRAGLTYHTIWTLQDGERAVRMTKLRELVPEHWKGGKNAGEVTINDRSIAMGDLGQAWLRGETDTIERMIGRQLQADEVPWFQEAQDYMRTLTAQWGEQTGNIHHAGDTVWPRFVQEADGSVRIRRPVGARQSPVKVRVFETMEEGIRKEIPYTDPLQTLDLFGRAFQKMTRDDILAKVVIEDDIGRIIDPKGLLDPDLVAATEAVRIKYRDASRARRAVQNERVLTAGQQREAIEAARRSIERARTGLAGTQDIRRAQARLTALEAEQSRLAELRVGRRETRQQFQARLAESTAAEKQAGREWKAQRRRHTEAFHAAQSRALTGRRGERAGISLGPGLSRIIFPEANLKVLEDMLGPANVAMQQVSRVAAIPRLTQAGLMDMGQGGIQMATVFFRRPQNWARGMASGFREAFSPGSFQRWAAESPVARDAIAHDVQVVGSFEPIEAIVGGGLLEKAAGTKAGKVLTAFARAFDASIGVTKAWEYDALARISRQAGEPADELFRIGSYVNTKLGTTNTREMGISATQRAAESGLGFFSPRYTRSIPGFLAWAMSNGVPARDARESLFLLMLGGVGTFYGLARASGLSHDETVHRLNPQSRGQFMSIPVFGNEVGFGSAWRSYIKFMGDMARHDSWDFDSWDDAALNNPITRFLRSRTSPVTGTLMDFLTGEDFIGREVSIQGFIDDPALMLDYASESILPFGLDSMMEARGGLKGRAATFGAEFAGGRAFPESSFVRFERAREDEFQRRKSTGEFSRFDSYEDLRASNRAAADEIDASAPVVAAQAELDESQTRRRQTDEGRFFEAREQVLDEFRVEQTEDDQNLSGFFRSGGEAGLDPQRWRELQSERLGRSFERRAQIKIDFAIEFERETGKAPPGSVNAAIEEYFAVDAERFTDPVTRDIDPAFYDVRDRAFDGLSAADRASAFAIINKNRTPVQRDLESLRRQPFDDKGSSLDDYYAIPSEDRTARDRWRRRNPKGDAILFVTGSVTTLIRSASRREAETLVRRIFGTQASVPRDVLWGRTRARERRDERRSSGGLTFSDVGRSETLDLRPRQRRAVELLTGGLGR